MLTLENLEIALNDVPLFPPLSLSIGAGEIASIMGPSGCGKSTLLSAICGHLAPGFVVRGDIRLNRRRLPGLPMEDRRVGILFQDDLLFPHMNIAENLAFALPFELPRREKRHRVAAALQRAELPGFEKRDPATLSGGQRARVALLRCLLAEPEALLLDEPFSRLDQSLKDRVRAFVFDMIRERQIPALIVSHDRRDFPPGQVIELTGH